MTLYCYGIKRNYRTWLMIAAVLTMYISLITIMFDPKMSILLQQLTDAMPELMSSLGMGNDISTLIGFMANYLYGFLMIIFPLVLTILLSNQLIAKYVDNSSMTYLLASPNTRSSIIRTQIAVLLTMLVSLLVYVTVLGIVCSQIFFPGELDISGFLQINLGLCALHLAMSSICFLFSCLTNETKYSLSASVGITVFFYLLQMLANTGDKFSFFKYFTLFSMFDPIGIISGDSLHYIFIAVLIVIAVALFVISNLIFKRKDLPI